MANSYFRFKQFIVHQDKTAMKVCTDACLFGAWVAHHLKYSWVPVQRILDIGTGTGLLSLILSQQLKSNVEAVELDEQAYRQAEENFACSPWSGNIQPIKADILNFQPAGKYGLIISNPPFFENDLKAQVKEKNLARHEADLTLDKIFSLAKAWLLPGAYLALLLPAYRTDKAIEIGVDQGLSLSIATKVRQTTRHDPFRIMLLFANQSCDAVCTEMAIKKNEIYTAEFKELLEPYYLYL